MKVGQFLVGDGDFDSNFGVEAEYMGSSTADLRVAGVDLDYDLKTYGLYGTYRYTFPHTPFYQR